MTNFLKYIFIVLIYLIVVAAPGYSQADQPIEKSAITETINGKDYYLHFVKQGQTLFAIARAYGLTVDDIFRENPDSRKGVSAGTVLKIPAKPAQKKKEPTVIPQEASTGNFFYHIVKKQETLYGIASKYGVSIESVKRINPELGEYPREGETLKIPFVKDDPSVAEAAWQGTSASHVVQPGETLYGIARAYDVTIGEIKNANPGLTDAISAGSTLLIPNQGNPEEEEAAGEADQNSLVHHTVLQGETLYGIARHYAIAVDTLRKYNPGIYASITPGQQILIPAAPADKGYIVHKPVKTESLGGISQKYEVSLGELEKFNPDIRKKAKKGQSVKIPVDRKEIAEEPVITDTEVQPDANEPCFDSGSNKENTYNIALMLPLFLQEIDSIDFDREKDFEKLSNLLSFRFAGFYAGFKMAVDSMTAAGMKINLFVYDVDNDPAKADRALQHSVLSSMDLIVGPFYLNSFNKVADFARTYQIPIVNPLSKREEIIYNNPWVFKVMPSEEKQTDLLVKYLAEASPESNIIVLRNNKYKYQAEVSFIRNSLNTSRPAYTYIQNDKIKKALAAKGGVKSQLTENKVLDPAVISRDLSDSTYFSNMVKEVIYVGDSLTGLRMNLSLVRPNVVVAISDDIVFSKEILSQLNKLKLSYDITLFGLPDWNAFSDLETSHLLNLNLHTFTPSLVNYNSFKVNAWIKKFRQTYHTEPSSRNFAFEGFDVGFYFLTALYNYGRDFTACLEYISVPLIQTRFKFEEKSLSGYQNTYWNLGNYRDYQYQKINLNSD